MQRVFEYRLRPNRIQEEALLRVLVGTRLLYNAALEEWKRHFEETGKYLHLYEQDKGYNTKTYPDLPAVVVDQTLKRLHRAVTRFFSFRKRGDACGFPRFKSANRWNSIEWRDADNTLRNGRFNAGKHCGGKIRAIVHRPLKGTFRHARIVKRASGWYLQCISEVEPERLPATGKVVGLDVGLKHLVADSEGNVIQNPRHLQSVLKDLGHSQRLLSRKRGPDKRTKQGPSNRWRKQAQVVARQHERVANRRRDALHKLSRQYVNEYDLIVVENLNVSGMVQCRSFSRSISDASWGLFRQMLADKAESAGRRLIAVSPHFTSQKCSSCGEHVEKSLSVRTHLCPHCGYIGDRDVNAARNILQRGLDEAIADCPTGAG